ncbi:MAG TPA: hypothetical protein VII69_10390 [Candidatus Eremiobacteraceae bacterium]
MDDSGYPLAQADRAFAYDGAYRTPAALSAASRSAYGMHDRTHREAPSFCEALLKAVHGPGCDKTPASHCGSATVLGPRQRDASGSLSSGTAQRDADPSVHAARTTIRPREPSRRPASVYYLFVACAGVVVRAIVRRGRVFSGGVRTCPTSKP